MTERNYLLGPNVSVPTRALYDILEEVSKDKVLGPTGLARELELSKIIVVRIIEAHFRDDARVKVRAGTIEHLIKKGFTINKEDLLIEGIHTKSTYNKE